MRTSKITLLLAILAIFAVACRPGQGAGGEASGVNINAVVEETLVGETILTVNLLNANGVAINDATVSIKGDMNHAGMVPVLREATGGTGGDYMIPFEWTMAGDWIVTVTAELADGSTASRDFDFSVDGEMGDMNHDDMEDMDHGDEHGDEHDGHSDDEHDGHGDDDKEHGDEHGDHG